MIQMDEQLAAYAEKYFHAFGCMPPLQMLPLSLTNEELFAKIDDCIARGKEDLAEQYCVESDEDILY